MPIIEYQCGGCLEKLERVEKFSDYDKPLKVCPLCEGEMRKLISKSTFALKGGGWHNTDYPKGWKKGDS